MDNIKATDVLLTVNNDTGPTHVTTTSDHDNVTGIELDEVCDLVLLDIKLDSVVGLDVGVGVANGSAVVGDDIGDALGTNGHFSDLEKLVARFLGCDAMNRETTLNVVKEAEVFARLFDGDDIWRIGAWLIFLDRGLEHPKNHTHETSGVGRVRPDLPIHLD